MAARQTGRKLNGYTARMAARMAGSTVRTIEAWKGDGILTPSVAQGRRNGYYDVYSLGDLIAIRAARRICGTRTSREKMEAILRFLQRHDESVPFTGVYLVTDGHQWVIEADEKGLVSILQQPSKPATILIVSLEAVEHEVREALGA